MNDDDLRHLLNEIEKRELPLLTWGISNGSFTLRELEDIVHGVLPDADVDDAIDELIERGLIVSKGVADERFRSRMAETVRLATSLRQWFHGKDWSTAPALVSDARFLSRPRLVPKRSLSPDLLVEQLRAALAGEWSADQERVVRALLDGRSVSGFQARATARLLGRQAGPQGTVVSAGTGAGKTLAFYLPALTTILANPRQAGVPRVLAIYPRIELLRDQLRTLLSTNVALGRLGIDAPKVGVLYGAVPNDRRDAVATRRRGWRQQSSGGLVCPIVTCPQPDCGGDLHWPSDAGEDEVLVCSTCGHQIQSTQFTFTRKGLRASSPVVLFTTTEMLNRQLGSGSMRRLLVGDHQAAPEYLLLDEVHTYSGTHGAQVGNLLRRWRSEVATAPHIVGLSATLADPIGFFSDLTGVATSTISVVAPDSTEMEEVGREYFLALRGDPASQTSLLSTTIQAAMLARRMLDDDGGRPSYGTFGSKLFVFADDLDVTNRLHSQLQDAEGWRADGVNRKPNGSLATLRSSSGPDVRAREEAGQVWGFAEQTGTLHRPMRVARTTSRDAGVDVAADIVVATASLEVGFDDPNVGAVLQHKAPRDSAQFLQRRGRAGRDPRMRPWTLVVLSDYGRDRLAFQAYETLFDPVVQPARLPLRNRVLLKMQATFWLLDSLSRVTGGTAVTSIIERPWQDRLRQQELARRVLVAIQNTLTEQGIARLSSRLGRSLALDEEDVRAVLWDHPRALVPAVLATLVRRLEAVAAPNVPEGIASRAPLRAFLPPSLFSPLQTPELEIALPPPATEPEGESLSHGLRQFAPGRVSYRYALGGRRERLWVEPPDPTQPTLPAESFCTNYLVIESPPGSGGARVIQPTSIQLQRPAATASDSSYGRWVWRAAFRHDGRPLELDVPTKGPWPTVLTAVHAFTHRYRCPQTVWRYANDFIVERNSPTAPPATTHSLMLDDSPVAIGFNLDVDALAIHVALPSQASADPALLRALRVARMEHLILTSHAMSEAVPSAFTREWLHQVFLSVIVKESEARSIADALEALNDDQLGARIIQAARDVFDASVTSQGQASQGASANGLVGDLSSAVNTPGVIDGLREAATALTADVQPEWLPWLHRKYMATLGAALIDAIQSACPDVDTSDLRCDVELETDAAGLIRISEEEPGGIGIIESAVDRYVEDPRRFWALVATALGPTDGERVDGAVRRFLQESRAGALSAATARVRTAMDLQDLTAAWRTMREAMFASGIDTDQSVIAALGTRVLRPGSSQDVESLLTDLLRQWNDLESALGIEVELRVFAYLAAANPDVRRRLGTLAHGSAQEPRWAHGQLVGILWPRGYRLRAAGLQTYSPYSELESSERLLYAHLVDGGAAIIDGRTADWRQDADEALRGSGAVAICVGSEAEAASIVHDFLTEPTSVDVLEFHPRVVGLVRERGHLRVLAELREALQ